MSDEVKAALEWWRGPHDDDFYVDPRAATLAKAYAELYQPDDDEPVTVEFCREHIADFDNHTRLYGNETVVSMKINFIVGRTTRGQLRRLLKAMEK